MMLAALVGVAAAGGSVAAPKAAPRLSAQGYGPVEVGMTRAQVERALGRDAQPRSVGGADPASCDEFHPRRAPAGLRIMLERGRVARFTAARAGVRSDRGVRVGDTVAQVRAAYRGLRLSDEPHKYVAAPARYLTWWARGQGARRGVRYEIDDRGRVSAIHAGGPAIEYVEGCA